jgi:DNA polymerase I-like protein with 3'-5' exonuclease and polymerase domains
MSAERMTVNFPIQPADILKRDAGRACLTGAGDARMILTVHDELPIESRARWRPGGRTVREAMQNAVALAVPSSLTGIGPNWREKS